MHNTCERCEVEQVYIPVAGEVAARARHSNRAFHRSAETALKLRKIGEVDSLGRVEVSEEWTETGGAAHCRS